MARDEMEVRRERLRTLRARAIDPYPSTVKRTHTLQDVATHFSRLETAGESVSVVGRVRAIRRHGGSTFMVLNDGTAGLQVYLKRDRLPEQYSLVELSDLGDFAAVSGTAFMTHRGERSLMATDYGFAAKSLRPLPEKWHGLSDVETRYRKRYLDLIANEDARLMASKRSTMVRSLRRFLDDRGFIEVETPVLQPVPGGATARPFATHLNALNLDLYLRVAPELYLKRLLVGGFTKVYEVARCFRNEGMDHAHNPEFTQAEIYEAYTDYAGLRERLEELLTVVVLETAGSLVVPYAGQTLDFTPPYAVRDWTEALQAATGDRFEDRSDEDLRRWLRRRDVAVTESDGRGALLDQAYKTFVLPTLMQPTFLIDHPLCLSPLAKPHRTKIGRAERFQLILGGGVELMNGFSELNDPLDQRERLLEQERLRRGGDEEAQRLDEGFLEAIEYGLPPAAGVGIGLDRLAAVLTNSHSVKEVILFPTLRPPAS